MWDGVFMLLLLCFVMAGASFLAGILPLSFSLSSRQLRLITALGTGVLVGTSLIVIIPEGVETLYSSSGSTHGHEERSIATTFGGRGAISSPLEFKHHIWRREALPWALEGDIAGEPDGSTFRSGPDDGYSMNDEEDTQTPPSSGEDNHDTNNNDDDDHPHDSGPAHRDPHAWVGISLILGFVLMYLIDTLPRVTRNTPTQPQRFPVSLNQFSFHNRDSSSVPNGDIDDPSSPTQDTFSHPSHPTSRPSSTTVGLVIHAAADGIALGASSTTSSSSSSSKNLTFIIFLALMIHKAPAAFGLTSVLLKQGLSKRRARAHLIIFALAAPIGALLTWSGAHLLGYSSESSDTEFATGVLLLFSAGTFLYVAMHTMQDGGSSSSSSSSSSSHHGEEGGYAEMNGNGNGVYGDGGPSASSSKQAQMAAQPPRLLDTMVTVGGMLLPLLTQFGHAH